MAQRSTLSDRYALDFQSDISTAVECSSGIDTDKSGLTIFNHGVLYSNQKYLDILKTIRSASRNQLIEYKNTVTDPSTIMQLLLSPKQVYPPLKLFFQKGSMQDPSSATTKWFYPYSYIDNGSLCESWATIVRDLSSGESLSHRLIGVVASKLSFNINASEYITLNVDFNSRQNETDYNSSGDNFTLSTDAPLLWRNSVTKFGDSYSALETMDLKSFSLDLKNNLSNKKFNSQYIQKFLLGRVEGKGSITIPWENTSTSYTNNVVVERFLSGSVNRLSIYFGNQYVNTGSTMSINMLIRYVSGNISQDQEISNEMTFVLVEDASLSTANGKISKWEINASSADTMVFTFTGSETLIGNVFPGDVVLTLDASAGSNTRWEVERILDSTSLTLTQSHTAGVGASGITSTIIRQPINIGLNDNLNRSIS